MSDGAPLWMDVHDNAPIFGLKCAVDGPEEFHHTVQHGNISADNLV